MGLRLCYHDPVANTDQEENHGTETNPSPTKQHIISYFVPGALGLELRGGHVTQTELRGICHCERERLAQVQTGSGVFALGWFSDNVETVVGIHNHLTISLR